MLDMKKENLRRKARLVVGDYAVDSSHTESHSLPAQPISIRELLTIAVKHKLKVVSRDASNTFLRANTTEKVHAVASPKFRERESCMVEIVCNVYGIATGSRS